MSQLQEQSQEQSAGERLCHIPTFKVCFHAGKVNWDLSLECSGPLPVSLLKPQLSDF